MNKVKIGIIGTGGISNKHIAELLKCENAQIVALCDVDEKALADKAKAAKVAAEKCSFICRRLWQNAVRSATLALGWLCS